MLCKFQPTLWADLRFTQFALHRCKREIERLRDSLNLSIFLLLICFILTSCTSIRPVVKIGLLAPFEGSQRRSGYAALTAMRQAIADSAPAAVAIMPLALDSGADPAGIERAARKLLQDKAVRAIVGPYTPLLVQPMAALVMPTGLPWLVPFAVNPTHGFIIPDVAGAWALPVLTAAAEQAAALGRQRLVLAGLAPEWPQLTPAQAESLFALPLLVEPNPTIESTDAVFWLGNAEDGANYFTVLRNHFPDVPFLLAPHADELVFSEQAQISGPVYLLYWHDDGYASWRIHYPGQPPIAYLTYRATQSTIAQHIGQPLREKQSWRVQTVLIDSDKAGVIHYDF